MPLTLRAVALKSLSGYGLRQWVVTFLLVATDKVVTILLNHPIRLWNLIGRVLQISIHGDDHISLCFLETTIKGRALTIVTTELDAFHMF